MGSFSVSNSYYTMPDGTKTNNYLQWDRAKKLWDAETEKMIAGNTASGNVTTDANNSNPNFSWNNEDLWSKAKEMSQTQLDNTIKTMGAASGYRASELRLNDEITRGQAQQQFGFNKQLADDNYNFQKQRAEQDFGFNKTLADDNYNFQKQRAEQDFGFNRTLANDGYDFQIRKANLDDEITRRQNEQRFGFERTLANDNYAFRDRDRAERERARDEEMEREYQMKRETTNSARDTASRAFFGGGNRFAARR